MKKILILLLLLVNLSNSSICDKTKRKMKKVILILLIALSYLNVSFAQESKQLIYKNQLLGTTWIQEDGENLYQPKIRNYHPIHD